MALKAFEVFGEVSLKGEQQVKSGLKGLVGDGGSFGGKFLTAAGIGIAAAGAAAVAGVGLVIKKGFDRALDIQDAKATLGALGYDLQQVQGIADDVVAAVKGTPFALNDAMGAATSALAAGVKEGEALTGYLAAIGDAATVAKVPFGDMAQIFNKVTGVGKVTGEVLQQAGERGIPVLQWLADEYGVTAEAMRDMVSRGEVDAGMFQQAITSNIGGAALAAGDTVRGASDNIMAAVGRLGAQFVEPLLEHIGGGFGKITEWIDGLGPIADNAGQMLSGIFGALKGDVGWDEILPPGIVGIFETIGSIFAPVIDTLKESFADLKETAGPAIDSLKNAWEQFQPVGELLLGIIGAVAAVIVGVLMGAINGLVNAFNGVARVVGGVVAIVAGYVNLLIGIFTRDGEKITEAVDGIGQGIIDVFGGLWDAVSGFITGFVDGVVGFFTGLWDTLVGHSIIPDIVNDIVAWFTELPGMAADALSAFVSAVVGAMSDTAVNAISAVDNMVADIIAALKRSPIFGPMIEALENVMTMIGRMRDTVVRVLRDLLDKIRKPINDAKNLLDRLNPFHRESPSLVDNVLAGVGAIERAYSGISGMTLAGPSLGGVSAGVGAQGASGGAFGGSVVIIADPRYTDMDKVRRDARALQRGDIGVGAIMGRMGMAT